MLTRATLANDTAVWERGRRHLGCWATTAGLELLLARSGGQIVRRIPSAAIALDAERQIPDAIREPLLVVNGEGTLHHDSPRALGLTRLVQAAVRAGRRVWIVNHESVGNARALEIYRGAEYVAGRDVESVEAIRAAGFRAELSADGSWLVPPAPERPREAVLLACSGCARVHVPTVEDLAERLGLAVRWCDAFYRTGMPGAVSPETVAEAFDLFAGVRCVVSSSYHGCVFAAIHGTPFVPLRTCTPKTLRFAAEFYGKEVPDPRMSAAAATRWLEAATGPSPLQAAMRARACRNAP